MNIVYKQNKTTTTTTKKNMSKYLFSRYLDSRSYYRYRYRSRSSVQFPYICSTVLMYLYFLALDMCGEDPRF